MGFNNIFNSYDIRGVFGVDLTIKEVNFIIEKFSRLLKESDIKVIFLAYDKRPSSLLIKKEVIKILLSNQIQYIDMGIVHTPFLYYLCNTSEIASGIMITASHNCFKYNGFKLILNKRILSGEYFLSGLDISAKQVQNQHIQKISNSTKYGDYNYEGFQENIYYLSDVEMFSVYQKYQGHQSNIDRICVYIDYLLSNIDILEVKKSKIIFDVLHGSTECIISRTMKKIGSEYKIINYNNTSDKSYSPNPSLDQNIKKTVKFLLDTKFDIAFLIDGDGDRIFGIIRDNINCGYQILNSEDIIYIFILEKIKQNSNKIKIIVDVKFSQCLINKIESLGVEVIISRCGHNFIKEEMLKHNADFGAEISGHIYFGKHLFCNDDAILAALKVASIPKDYILSNLQKKFISDEYRLPIKVEDKASIIAKATLHLERYNFQKMQIDGVKFFGNKGSILIRISNTENVLSSRIEGTCEKSFKRYEQIFLQLLNALNIPNTL